MPIIDADIYHGQVFIVSEYADGGSLADKLKCEGKLPIQQAVEMTIDILKGLEYLHNKGIIHRDIKPANILLQGENPRLADFGLSRVMTDSSFSLTIAGTSTYMAIEAFSGKRNEKTDIFALGVILYLLLTGKLPFLYRKEITNAVIAENETLLRQYKDEVPAQLPNEIPQELQRIVEKALAKLHENRYASAGEMRKDLRKLEYKNNAYVNETEDETEIQTKVQKNETEDETEIQTKLQSVQTEIKTVVRQQIREASERIVEDTDKTEQLVVEPIKNWQKIEAEKQPQREEERAKLVKGRHQRESIESEVTNIIQKKPNLSDNPTKTSENLSQNKTYSFLESLYVGSMAVGIMGIFSSFTMLSYFLFITLGIGIESRVIQISVIFFGSIPMFIVIYLITKGMPSEDHHNYVNSLSTWAGVLLGLIFSYFYEFSFSSIFLGISIGSALGFSVGTILFRLIRKNKK